MADLNITIRARNLAEKDIVAIKGQLNNLDKAVKNTDESAKKTTSSMSQLARVDLSGLLKMGVAAVSVGAVTAAIGGTIKAASDLNETTSKTGVVFGSASSQVMAFGEKASASFGQSKQQALAAASDFGNLFKSMGQGTQAAASMSIEMTKLASDLASFHNIPIDQALQKLRAGLVGEAEPMRTLGVLLNEATVKAKAMEMGLANASGELSEAAKVQARYAIILEQTKDAQGDFARTSDGLANASRIIEASFADLQAEIGARLLPGIASVASGFAKTLPQAIKDAGPMLDAAGLWIKAIGDGMGLIGSTAGGAAKGIGDVAAAASNAIAPQGTYAEILKTTNEQLAEMYRLEDLNLTRQSTRARRAVDAPGPWGSGMRFGGRQIEDTFDYRGAADAADEFDASQARIAASIQSQLDPALNLWARDLDDINANAYQTEAANKAMEASAKKAGGAAESAAKKAATAFERVSDDARETARDIESELGASLIRVADIAQDSGDRWIEKWYDVDTAIKSAQRSAEEALQAMAEQETLSTSTSIRRKNLNERLADEDYHHREQKDKERALREYQKALNKASDGDQRKAAEERYNEELEQIRQAHIDYDEEQTWRRYLEGERAKLEEDLHREEQDRRHAAILKERDDRITAINTEWSEWQDKEKSKTEKLQAEEKARAKAKLRAFVDDFTRPLADESAPGIEAFAAMVQAKLGSALAVIGGDVSSGGSGWVDGNYVDPEHAPGGSIFETWKVNEPEQYEAWKQEHGLAKGGIVMAPGLFAVGENAPRVPEAVIPLPSGGLIDYDKLAAALAKQPIVMQANGREIARMVRQELLRDKTALGPLGLGLS